MDKKAVAAALEEIALLSELAGENPFKVRAFASGARTVLTFPGDLGEAVRRGELSQIKGIGKSIAAVIAELTEKDEARVLQELRQKVSPGLLELLQVPGLGPKKAKILHDQLHIANLGELEYAIQENRLLSFPGFGAKTQEKLKAGLDRVRRYAGLFRLGDLLPLAQALLERIRRHQGVLRAELAGGVRRGLEVDDTIVLTVAIAEPQGSLPFFEKLFPDAQVTLGPPGRLETTLPQGMRLVLVWAEPEKFGAAWLLNTGSPDHLQELTARAAKAGLQVTPQGLFSQGQRLPSGQEEEIYGALGFPFIPPELREGQGEVEAAAQGRLPRLIQPEDVQGCFHVHSYYSDGVNSPVELVNAARERGWKFLGLSDHSQSAYYACGLKPPDLARQKTELAALRLDNPDFMVFWGIESDILGDGSLDYQDEVLRDFDFVIASVHSQFGLTREEMTRRLLQAMANPFCTMLGHVTGRLLLAREPYEVDLEQILEFAGQHQVMVEINASPYRLDLDWRWLRRAKDLGVLISLNPDAHSLEGLDDVAYGVIAARKGWLEPPDVLNTYPPEEVAHLLHRRR
ncbi:MAG: helix-hairpin-helix domain-containing protein [Syntrophobacterales bacterium]|jgi:DNA polymerase (family 10)